MPALVLADHDGGPTLGRMRDEIGMRHVYALSSARQERERPEWCRVDHLLEVLGPHLLDSSVALATNRYCDYTHPEARKRFAHFVRTPSGRRQSRFRFEHAVEWRRSGRPDSRTVSGCRRREWCRWATWCQMFVERSRNIEECPGGPGLGVKRRPICGVAAVHHSPRVHCANPGFDIRRLRRGTFRSSRRSRELCSARRRRLSRLSRAVSDKGGSNPEVSGRSTLPRDRPAWGDPGSRALL